MSSKVKVRIDKDYCSSTVWLDGCNWEESDFNFNEEQLSLAKRYDTLWEEAHTDLYNVDQDKLYKANIAKFLLLDNLIETKRDIVWMYFCEKLRMDVIYKAELQ